VLVSPAAPTFSAVGGTTLLLLGLAGAELLLVVIDFNPITIFRTVFFQQSVIVVVLKWGIFAGVLQPGCNGQQPARLAQASCHALLLRCMIVWRCRCSTRIHVAIHYYLSLA
jgi:hypothetical protein